MGLEAGVQYARTGVKASGYPDTGVELITDTRQADVNSKDTVFGLAACRGK